MLLRAPYLEPMKQAYDVRSPGLQVGLGLWNPTVDDRNPASAYIGIYVLYFKNSYAFGICGLYKLLQDFYHQQ